MGNTAPISCDLAFNWEQVTNSTGTTLPAREGHGGVQYNGSLYIFGGIQDCSARPVEPGEEEEEFPSACMNDLYQFDIEKNEWKLLECKGEIPSPRSGFISAVLNNQLFIFGGLDPLYGWLNDGFIMNFETKTWKKLTFTGDVPSPRDKIGFTTLSKNKLIIFGGFGPQELELEEGEEETATFGWFNETFTFDVTTSTWTRLKCSGELPTPRAAAGVALIQRPKQKRAEQTGEQKMPQFTEEGEPQNYLYVMGGRDNQGSRTNDLFSLELSSNTWEKQNCRGTAPAARSFHTCVAANDKLLVFGGANVNHMVLNDIHILDTRATSQHAWIQPKDSNLDPLKQPEPRAFHATISTIVEGAAYTYVHGGTGKLDAETGEHQNLCQSLWRINLSPLFEYRAPEPAAESTETKQ
mmetsp:Transcript_15302/g.19428  ORF Transcript_15302/g.19428 Transcript_15302/m.19428 type:complete len:410 (-) Transcript_15302:26-1255(-)